MDSSEAMVRFQLFRPATTVHIHPTPTQNIYERATKAELAKDLDTAFRLYIEAGDAFLNLTRASAALRHVQEEARQCAARAVERAERIKAVKADLAPVWRDLFAPGSYRAFFSILDESPTGRNAHLQRSNSVYCKRDRRSTALRCPYGRPLRLLWELRGRVRCSGKCAHISLRE